MYLSSENTSLAVVVTKLMASGKDCRENRNNVQENEEKHLEQKKEITVHERSVLLSKILLMRCCITFLQGLSLRRCCCRYLRPITNTENLGDKRKH